MTVFEFIKIANPLISLPNPTKTMQSVVLSSTVFNTRRREVEEKRQPKPKQQQQQKQRQQQRGKKSSKQKKKRSVRFQPTVKFREIQHVYELGAIDALWYTLEDFHTFAKDGYKELLERKYYHQVSSALTTTNTLSSSGSNNNEELSSSCNDNNNYYHHTSLYSQLEEQNQRRVFESIWSVRIFQARNKNDGLDISDPTELAAVYTPHCIQSSQNALLIGMNDARWVQQEQKRFKQQEEYLMTKRSFSSSSSSLSSSSSSQQQQQPRRRSSSSSLSYNTRKDYKNQRERYLKAKLPRVPTTSTRRQHHHHHGAVVVASSSTITTRAR